MRNSIDTNKTLTRQTHRHTDRHTYTDQQTDRHRGSYNTLSRRARSDSSDLYFFHFVVDFSF